MNNNLRLPPHMIATQLPINDFLKAQNVQFIIPVYQRNYDWTVTECRKLLRDILEVSQEERISHFIGSIVFIHEGAYSTKEVKEQKIIDTFNNKEAVDDFSVVVNYEEIKAKNYSLSAGQYFEVKIEYVDITAEEFETKMQSFDKDLNGLFIESRRLESEIKSNLKKLKYES